MAVKTKPPRTISRGAQVHWGQWADGHWWQLQKGKDHDQAPREALKAARMWAVRNGYWVNAELPPRDQPYGCWKLCFTKREPGQPQPAAEKA